MITSSASKVQPPLLIIEDSNEDFEAFQRFLRQSPLVIPVYRCLNGDQALAFLYHTDHYTDLESAPRPGLILLDLNLPGTDGREVLRRIKQDDDLKLVPTVIFTTSNNPKDIEDCYRQGVNSYIIKPMDFGLLKRSIQTLLEYWFDITMLPQNSL
ncbi:response regulator [Phormidium sp. CLA17]|uniref:response regulator n=1 Tax=Leptolyngbya sp. Cla-17 TaxID=2803751 RepID=UPI0014919DFB|nr:response regulator [Leptolyngbya sp. Cla-17]MBM0741613.1 response regulator [Leptolyngbya sp. Cla-17]